MFVSTRKKFRKGDKRWNDYMDSVDLPHLSEVRTIDFVLNSYAPHSGDTQCMPETLAEAVEELPVPDPSKEYYMLAVNLTTDPPTDLPSVWKLLGYDLSDESHISTLLNCGPSWEAKLKPLTERLNDVGLLSLPDAKLAQKLLPEVWGQGMDHAHVDIWALYERSIEDQGTALEGMKKG